MCGCGVSNVRVCVVLYSCVCELRAARGQPVCWSLSLSLPATSNYNKMNHASPITPDAISRRCFALRKRSWVISILFLLRVFWETSTHGKTRNATSKSFSFAVMKRNATRSHYASERSSRAAFSKARRVPPRTRAWPQSSRRFGEMAQKPRAAVHPRRRLRARKLQRLADGRREKVTTRRSPFSTAGGLEKRKQGTGRSLGRSGGDTPTSSAARAKNRGPTWNHTGGADCSISIVRSSRPQPRLLGSLLDAQPAYRWVLAVGRQSYRQVWWASERP
ncbi:hypothetical protein BDZ88DRAFT_299053 [Geranomyces variabilis]|nr:hypothetical protein BDZ88DRAFT_299053 [Geranomyces variabilis]